MRVLGILTYLETQSLSVLFRLFGGKNKRHEIAEKTDLALKAIKHHFLNTYLIHMLSSIHYLTFSDGFYTIESAKHANIPSVIEEMQDCYLTASTGDVVIDIGANYGFYSMLSSRLVGNEGVVLAFEPESTNYDILVANLGLNNIINVETFKMALGAVDGETKLYLSEHPGAHSTASQVSSLFETVIVKRLDSVLKELCIEKVDLIKLDAEGAELGILYGALETISKHKPSLTIASYHYVKEAEDIERFLKQYMSFYKVVRKINPGEGAIIHAIFKSQKHVPLKNLAIS
jgi:FkbM family methyltransferase